MTQLLLSAATAVAFACALYFWTKGAPGRSALRAALGPSGLRTPEETLDWYDAHYLRRFMQEAQVARLPDGRTALEAYRDTLLRTNIRFAFCLAAFLVLGNIAIAPSMPLNPYGTALAIACAAMGAAYGLFDVFEDVKLRSMFANAPQATDRDALSATLLTHGKFITLYLALPAAVGLAAKLAHDHFYDQFYGFLKLWPLAVVGVACFVPVLARVLWACRISVISVMAGYVLFLFVIQAQDLFADTSFGDRPLRHIAYWASVYLAVAFIWALPVHYAARAALEGTAAAWYAATSPERLRRWTPRLLGAIPPVAVLLGIFGAAIETRYAMRLDDGLARQYVLLAAGGWFTLGFVLLFTIERRHLVNWLLKRPASFGSRLAVRGSAVVTSIVFFLLYVSPLSSTHWVVRAALVPVVLGSGVLLFGAIARAADRTGKPWTALAVVAAMGLTAANAHFNDVRPLPTAENAAQQPQQMLLPKAIDSWRAANHCADALRDCPPALVIAADGGASRAAYFTAAVVGHILDELAARPDGKCADKTNPARCIFAMSGVSGGSLGVASIKANLLDTASGRNPCDARRSECFTRYVSGDYLSPVFVGLAFRDLLAPPLPGYTDPNSWGDRAALLEQSWERAYLAALGADAKACGVGGPDIGLCRPFARPQPGGAWTPLVLLNGTSVQTGRRVIASELAPVWTSDGAGTPRALHTWAYDFFDMFGASCGGGDAKADPCRSAASAGYGSPDNVRLSTAALVSARFPLVSPAGVVHMRGDGNPHGDEIVDGGYFENSGLTTALDVAAGLRAFGLSPIVVSISNDPTPQTVATVKAVGEALNCSAAPDASALHLDVGTAAANSWWIRAVAVVYAPFAALAHTRDGHAEEAAQVLTERLREWNAPGASTAGPCAAEARASFFPIRVYAEGSDFAMPDLSMSWWLSPVVRKALARQLRHPANEAQFAALLKRMSGAGCSDCGAAQAPK